MNAQRVLGIVHLALAALFLVFALLGSWTKRSDPDPGAFASDGGTGFGLIAVILGVGLVLLGIMRLMGRDRVLPGFGVEQLTIAFALAAIAVVLGFVVGWLAVFPAGTGWAIPAAYFPVSFIAQIGFLTLSAKSPEPGIQPLQPARARVVSIVALLGGSVSCCSPCSPG